MQSFDGDLKKIQEMKKNNTTDFDCDKEINRYILGGAADRGSLAEIKKLINLGFGKKQHLEDALISACFSGQLHIVKYLVEEQNMSLVKIGYKCAEKAVEGFGSNLSDKGKEVEVIQYLASKGVNIHAKNDALFKEAVENGGTDMVECFVKLGSNIEYAAKNGDEDIKEWTLEYLLKERKIH